MEGNQWLFDSVDVDGSRRVRSDSKVRKKWEGTTWGPHYGQPHVHMYVCTLHNPHGYNVRITARTGLRHLAPTPHC